MGKYKRNSRAIWGYANQVLRVSHTFWILNCAIVTNVTCVHRTDRFKEKDKHLLVGDRLMFHTSRNNQKFAFAESYIAFVQTHEQFAFDNQEHFIFVVVMMPDELAQQFGEFNLLAVQFTHNAWAPMFSEG